MKIAVPSRKGEVDSHFGHCEYFTLFSLNKQGKVCAEEKLTAPSGCGCKSNLASSLADLNVDVMLAGNMGQDAANKLNAAGISVIRGFSGTVQKVIEAYTSGELTDAPVICHDHGSCPEH